MQANIGRQRAEISLLEFNEVLNAHPDLKFWEVDHSFDGLTGEKVFSSESLRFFKFPSENEIAKLEYVGGRISVCYVPIEVCEYLAQKLNAHIYPVYYHG